LTAFVIGIQSSQVSVKLVCSRAGYGSPVQPIRVDKDSAEATQLSLLAIVNCQMTTKVKKKDRACHFQKIQVRLSYA
jgi:hypothetical protein